MTKQEKRNVEYFAENCVIPTTVCMITKALYGYNKPVLDTKKLDMLLAFRGWRVGSEGYELAMLIVDARWEERIGS